MIEITSSLFRFKLDYLQADVSHLETKIVCVFKSLNLKSYLKTEGLSKIYLKRKNILQCSKNSFEVVYTNTRRLLLILVDCKFCLQDGYGAEKCYDF